MGYYSKTFLDTLFSGYCYIEVTIKSCDNVAVQQQDDVTIGMLYFCNCMFLVSVYVVIFFISHKNHHLRVLKYVWRLTVKLCATSSMKGRRVR